MCGGGEPDRIRNVIDEIKKLKKSDVNEKLSNQLYHVMMKLQAIVDARPKPKEDSDVCPCGQC